MHTEEKATTEEVNSLLNIKENSEGETIAGATLKERAVMTLASLIYNDEVLLNEALEYCMKDGNQMTSMEEYVSENFSRLLPNFPELQKEYIDSIKLRNKKLRRKRKKK